MQLKNSEVVELAKFFLFDPVSKDIQYKFDAHKIMSKNIYILKEVYTKLANMERSVLAIRGSDQFKKFFEDLKKESTEFILSDDNSEDSFGQIKIIDGCEASVMEIQKTLIQSDEYSEIMTDLSLKESDLRDSLSSTIDLDLSFININDLNLDDLTLNSTQWDLISLISTEGN